MKKNIFLLFCFVFFLFFFCYSGVDTRQEKNNHPDQKAELFSEQQLELLKIHNEKRKSKGLSKLEISETLCSYAQTHAETMAIKNSLFHSSMADIQKFSGADVVGENIAWGQEDAESVVSNWMWSPMHRWNILGYSYKKVGFGIKEDDDGRKYWCVVFSD